MVLGFWTLSIVQNSKYWKTMFPKLVQSRNPVSLSVMRHNEELRDFYSSPSIIRIIMSKRIRWEGMQRKWGRRGMRIGYWWESHREIGHYEYRDIGAG
jgi:hypothetical protein